MITIRRIQTGEADLYRQVRLTALQDAPFTFSLTYDLALQRSAESWREQADRSAQGRDRATFIAFANDLPVGTAALYRLEDQADTGELLQVGVSPEYRGFKWAGENKFRRVIAGVTKGNARALKFYVNYGFTVITGSLPNDSEGVSLVKEVK